MQSIPIANASWGLILGLPFSFGLAGLASTIRWKGAKYCQPEPLEKTPNAPGQDEDEVDNALYVAKAEEVEEQKKKKAEKRKALKNMGIMYGIIGIMTVALNYLPVWAQELYMVTCMSMPTALLGSITLCDITGFSKCRMARTSQGVLRAWDEYSNKGCLFFAPLLVSLVACLAYIPTMPTYLQIGIYTLFAALIPFRVGVLFNSTKADSMALKWVLFGYTALITFSCAAVALIIGVVYIVVESGLWAKVFGESDPAEPKPEKPLMRQSLMDGIMPVQITILASLLTVVISQLYRIDVTLAQRKAHGGVVRLEEIADGTDGLYVQDFEKHSEEDKKDAKEKVSSWMLLPSYWSLIRSGNIKHFLVRPRYSLLGLVTIQGLLLGMSSAAEQIVAFFHKHDAAWTRSEKEVQAFAGVVPSIAIFLAPFAMTLTLGIASFINGEARFIFNYQASWKVPVAKTEQEGTDTESEPFMDEKAEDVEAEVKNLRRVSI